MYTCVFSALPLQLGLDYTNPYISPFKEFQVLSLYDKRKSMNQGNAFLRYSKFECPDHVSFQSYFYMLM